MEQTELLALEKTPARVTIPLALAMLLASLGTSIANIALPTLAKAFSAPFVQVQAVVVAYLAALTISVVIAGRLGDRLGLKPMLATGLAVFAGASMLCAIAPTLWLLIGARALQGIGAAFLMTLAIALMRQTASEGRIGRAMGLLGTVSAMGTALGPSLGGLLIPMTGWRGIFWVQVPLAILALFLAISMLPPSPNKGKAASIGLRSEMNLRLAPNLLANLLVASVMMTTLVVGPFYLGMGLGLTETQVGFVMAVGPVISIFSGVPAGQLVDTFGYSHMLAIGLILLAAGAFLLALLPNMIGVTGYVLSIIILTPGYQLFQAANNTAALANVLSDRRGTVSGLLSLSRNIGLITGASAMGATFAFGVGTDELSHATALGITSGMRLTFLVAGGLILVAMGVMFRHFHSAHTKHPQ
ncbi:MFS transporter [Mangrovitalea sediminis]|uniref:MFS transporter n=1 Tax=Mangrovitalea sediminis TaxID=1982043 RepID=UPI000BE609DE|nr:MFS transporter [Mangrovitalea sediminis]